MMYNSECNTTSIMWLYIHIQVLDHIHGLHLRKGYIDGKNQAIQKYIKLLCISMVRKNDQNTVSELTLNSHTMAKILPKKNTHTHNKNENNQH